jgi:exosortase A
MATLMIKAFPIAAMFIAWFYIYYQGIITAINIWSISEIFNHCFLVLPGAFFLIYKKRLQLIQQPFIINSWVLIPLIGTLLLYTFGHVGSIRLFMHIATFVSLPLLIWLFIGNQAARVIAFPLYFMVFSIPVGEELIPFLQELTTDLAVPLLEMTGVPIFRNGLYLDIPEGRFLVAEACSGISFLIASVVFGNLYAYLSFKTLTKQLMFILVSILVPILANALRVYGIILTAHLTDMEYAAGADHLIYGGVFYTIILFLLIFIGEKFRDQSVSLSDSNKADRGVNFKANNSWKALTFVLPLFVTQSFWLSQIESNKLTLVETENNIDFSELPFTIDEEKLNAWQPNFDSATNIQQGYIKQRKTQLSDSDKNIEFFVATYAGGEGELISSLNRLYSSERWVLLAKETINVDNEGFSLVLTKLVSPTSQIRYIAHWYQLGDMRFTSKIKVKLYQTLNLLLGKKTIGRIVAFSIQSSPVIQESRGHLEMLIKNNKVLLNKALLDQ